MKKYYYVDFSELDSALNAISKAQSEEGVFYNVTVKPYSGSKYGPDTVVIQIG